MKFLIFSDLHHAPGVFVGGSYEDLRTMERAALDAGCDFIIHAGDFCHGPSEVRDYVEAYNALRFSADTYTAYNPTVTTVWLFTEGNLYSIAPGETVILKK